MSLKIKVITTKKKLSKSVINQMRTATEHIITVGSCLGHVVGIKKNVYELAIIKHEGDYYVKALNYVLSTASKKSMYRRGSGRGNYNYSFKTEKEREVWWDSYSKMKKIALKNHIYI